VWPKKLESKIQKKYFVYILLCADQTFYTGYTDDLDKRLKTHNAKKGAKYTRSRAPLKLIYSESFETKSEAMKREKAIQSLTRDQKKNLLHSKHA
jgi:putative endonuclease